MNCIDEFGPHTDHSDCARILDLMRGDYIEPYDEPAYLSGTGEIESDSYINYLNRN